MKKNWEKIYSHFGVKLLFEIKTEINSLSLKTSSRYIFVPTTGQLTTLRTFVYYLHFTNIMLCPWVTDLHSCGGHIINL